MAAIVVHPDRHNERVVQLLGLLQSLGHPSAVVADFGALRDEHSYSRDPSSIIVVADTEGDPRLAEATIAFLEAGPAAFTLYVADTMAADAYKRLLRSQRGEWIEWQSAPQELGEAVGKLVRHKTDDKSAKVMSFFPSKGGVGNTTLALEVGICLASLDKNNRTKVAIVDLNFQGSSLADSLDLEPRFDITEFMNRPERLDQQLIDILTARYKPNVDVFSSPSRLIKDEELDPNVVFSLLDQLGKRYDIVVIDMVRHWLPWMDNVLQGSDIVVITGGSTVPAVKQLATRIQHVQALAVLPDRVTVVVNHCETGIFGKMPRKSDIDRTFPGQRVVYLPLDVTTATQAANSGTPMVELAPRRPICKGIRGLAKWMRATAASSIPLHSLQTG